MNFFFANIINILTPFSYIFYLFVPHATSDKWDDIRWQLDIEKFGDGPGRESIESYPKSINIINECISWE